VIPNHFLTAGPQLPLFLLTIFSHTPTSVVYLLLLLHSSVELIRDFCNPNPVQYFYFLVQSDPNSMVLSKYLIPSSLYPKKLWLNIWLEWSTQFRYPYLTGRAFFEIQSDPDSVLNCKTGWIVIRKLDHAQHCYTLERRKANLAKFYRPEKTTRSWTDATI